jgi:ABC-type Zn2+ transport system, periplasmic component/surface adhesin
MKLLEKITDFSDLSEDMSKTLATDGFVRATFYDDINEAIFNFNLDPDAPPAREDFKNTAFNNFIEFMKEYFTALPLSVRKSSMLMLLGSLPIAMDIHTLLDYIKDAIDNAQTFEHGLLIIDKAGATFTDNGFDFRTEDNEDKHHTHDEDCGCGHDHHHHDENCGCGHDHHHH